MSILTTKYAYETVQTAPNEVDIEPPVRAFIYAHALQHDPEVVRALEILETYPQFPGVVLDHQSNPYRQVSVIRNNVTYLNFYRATLEYGGPEEGGWWYDQKMPIDSQDISTYTFSQQLSLLRTAEASYGPQDYERDYRSVNAQGVIQIYLEPEPAVMRPRYRPYYE